MKAINIFKLPLTENTHKWFTECLNPEFDELEFNTEGRPLDICIALDECLCEFTQYAYVGTYEDKYYICWPEDEVKNVSQKEFIDDITKALIHAEYIKESMDISNLVENIDIEDYWK